MKEYCGVVSIALKYGGNPTLKMGRNQGQFHGRHCTFAEVGTWGGRHF